MIWKSLSLWIMAAFYFFAGLLHFKFPKTYLKIMPPYLPAPLTLVYVSGFAESALAVALLFPATRNLAAWGIIGLLVAVFPANIYMLQQGSAVVRIPEWVLIARIPLQFVFIYWAYTFTDHS